jgi:hypothetical protein
LRVGEIGEYLFRGLGDNVLTLRHSVPRVESAHLAGYCAGPYMRAFLAPHDEEKPPP